MKKLISMIALVAMVAMSSVAYAAVDNVPVSVTVDSGVILNIDTCGTTGLTVATMAANAETSATCNFIITANGTHDVFLTDDEDNTSLAGGNDDETCTAAGCILGGSDEIAGPATDGVDVAAATAEVGYYILPAASGETVATCNAVTSVCRAIDAAVVRPIDDDTNITVADDVTLGMAVSTNTDQEAAAYVDTWVLNLVVGI